MLVGLEFVDFIHQYLLSIKIINNIYFLQDYYIPIVI